MTERILRNIGSGIFAQAWSALLGLLVLPILVRGLGAERYGLLALSLAVIGFAAVADLGAGRAASKYLAEDYERNASSQTQQYISSALTICTVMGVAGTCILALSTPLIADYILRVPTHLVRETRIVLWTTSLGLLPVLLRITLDGALAGHHRIAELSIGNMIANTLKAGLSVAAVLTGRSIIGVVAANVCVSYLHALGLWLYTRHYFAGSIRIRWGWDSRIALNLMRLGLFSSASFLAGILLFYFDRFVIAAFLPLAALGYYSTVFDITSKQCYISSPIGQAFFPVFSGKSAAGPAEFERHYFQASKMQAVGLTGVAAMLIVLGRPLLTYWISPEVAVRGTPVMAILTLAMLLSSYVTLPYTAILVGSAHPEVCPKIFIAAFVVHVFFSIVLIKTAGISGVAVALLLAFAVAFLASCHWVGRNLLQHESLVFYFKHCFAAAWTVAAVVGIGWWIWVKPWLHNLWTTIAAFAAGYMLYLAGCGIFAYSVEERSHARKVGRRILGMSGDVETATLAI